MKANNYLVTWTDLSTMGLTARATPPTGLGIANKAELIVAYYVDENAIPFSTYTSNRCPRYQDIVPLYIPPLSVYASRDGYASHSNNSGFVFTNYSGLTTDDNYNSIGASDDGVYVCISKDFGLSDNGAILVSSNSGTSWTATSFTLGSNASNIVYSQVAVSSNGQYMITSVGFNVNSLPQRLVDFYKSNNYGATWTYITGYNTEVSGKSGMSQDGKYQAFLFSQGGSSYRYISSNYGATWTSIGPIATTYYNNIKMSVSGLYQIIASYNGSSAGGRIFVSSDSGNTFTEKIYDATYRMDYVAMTDDGVYQAGMGITGKYYVSINSGVTFSINGIISAGSIAGIAMSAYNYGSRPYILAYSYSNAIIYLSSYPYSTFDAISTASTLPWSFIQSRAIPYPYTPQLSYAYTLFYNTTTGLPNVVGFGDSTSACGATINSFTVYSNSSTVAIGMLLYFDLHGTQIISASSYNVTGSQYFKISGKYVTFENYNSTNTGYVIRTIGSCPETTVTLDWTVENQSGGNLKVFNNVGSTLLDITSTAGSTQTGTLTIVSSNLPYTIRGTWISGGAVAYRVCDISGSELYYSGSITSGSNDYTPSPTPNYASVNLAAQGVTPPTCAVFV